MNHELISQICFAEIDAVPSHQTARSLFTRLPHGMAYADTLIERENRYSRFLPRSPAAFLKARRHRIASGVRQD
ncbi:MAG: hypothetical protein Q8L49_13540 [Burkholderiaceae bacterium]|nr:hypothetical protein [Burkholderiaceae bacterium]